ncbi:tRNA uridine-5-carboxymethylaminomethyl(34) synthesis GTPase MnmE [Holdemanella biformis]
MFENTIAAISTSLQDGAISIIRLSGDQAIEITQKIFDRNIMNAKSHTIHYGFIIDQDKNPVDEVLISIFRAPKTYTREDIVEINCHGGTFITRKILSMVLSAGADLAKPGEFTQRAFYHGRIDLSQAEAVQDMIEASNNTAATMAIHGIKGSVKKLLQPLIDDLMDIIAQIEVNIDYPEYEDVEQLTTNDLLPKTNDWLEKIDHILSRVQTGQMLKKGIDTIIVGKPNVGKSSLLNALLEEDKAIVTDIAGTTRDLVEGQIHIGSVQLNLIDTAGIRKSNDKIEQIGIERTKQEISKADVILEIRDIRDQQNKNKDSMQTALKMIKGKDVPIITVLNKVDLISTPLPNTKDVSRGTIIETSAVTGKGMQELKSELLKLAGFSENQSIYMARERHIHNLLNVKESLKRAASYLNSTSPQLELFAEELRGASDELGEITGKISSDDLLGKIFSGFCIGK